MQLNALEALNKPVKLENWWQTDLDTTKMANDFIKKAREFLDQYWVEITKETCKWWVDNKDKTAAEIVAGLTPIIAAIIPPPWGWIVGS